MTNEYPVIGFYCLIFSLYWRIQLKRLNRWRCKFFYALTINFILSTAYFIILIIQVQFKINVSHMQVLYHCSDVVVPNGVQLIFELLDVRAERQFMGIR